MEHDKPKTVKVKALQAHTTLGHAYEIGAEYEIPADLVDSVIVQGKAVPVDHPAAAVPKPSHPVDPMTTDTFGKA